MDRRTFVKATSATGAIAWLAKSQGLGAQSPVLSPQSIPFVSDPAVSGLSPLDQENLLYYNAVATAAQGAQVFPQSVASGDPRSHGIVLWTRVEPSFLAAPAHEVIGWQIGTSAAFEAGSVVVEGAASVGALRDYTVKLAVEHPALQPFTVYFYRFLYNGVSSRPGRFKTLPESTASLAALRLGYVVCQDYGNGYYNALRYLAKEDVDYVVHLGDYIYETIASSSFQAHPVRIVPAFASGGSIPRNVDDYRHLYRVYRSDPDQQAVHERFAYIQLWDDHEFANDCHQDFHPDEDTAPVTPKTRQPELRQAANQAWSEYGLANTPFDSTKDWESSIEVYRTFSFGTLAEMIVTDERLYRDGPPCGDGQYGQRYFSFGCESMEDKTRTMLGVTQRNWFLNQISTTKATWKLWANEVMLMQLKFGPAYVSLDQWDGYQQERNLILNAVKHGNIKNFVALTGDLHTFLAGYLKTNFDNPFEAPVGVELMVGSITSANFAEEIEAVIPLASRPVPAKQMGVPPNVLNGVVRAANPWIQYWDSSTHGYGIVTLRPTELRCEFKAVTTIMQPEADLVPLRTFTVPVNRVHIAQS